MKYIFGTGAMRSGGSLVLSILELDNITKTFCEIFYFSRHLYKKFTNLNSFKTKYRIAYTFYLLLKYRNGKIIDYKSVYKELVNKKISNYSELYIVLSKYLISEKYHNFVEYSNGEWRFINDYLNLNKKFKAFLIMRDPRSVIASFKKISFGKKYDYLNCIFNWIDCYDYLKIYKKKLNKKRFLYLKFEDIHSNPEKNVKKICKFFSIKFKTSMLKNQTYKNKIKTKTLIFSAQNKEYSFGFNAKRNYQWIENLSKWEIALIEKLCGSRMKKIGYKLQNYKSNDFKKGIQNLKKNNILKQKFLRFQKFNVGDNLRMNDPTKAENWGSNKKNKNRFLEEKEYSNYKKELKKFENSTINIKY